MFDPTVLQTFATSVTGRNVFKLIRELIECPNDTNKTIAEGLLIQYKEAEAEMYSVGTLKDE